MMVNGYAATGTDWDPILLGKLARDFTVVCPDNRGTGGSELAAGAAITVGEMAADLLGVLDALEVEAVALAGWSMGGFVAQELAASHPERVGSLILLATDCGGPEAVLSEPDVAERLFDHSGTPREQASRLIALLFPPGPAAEIDARFGDVVAAARAALSTEALDAQEAAMAAWYAEPAEPRLAAIRAPTLVMAGDEDIVIPAANAPRLAAAIDAAELRTFPGAGHAFIAQQAPQVASAIRDFALLD